MSDNNNLKLKIKKIKEFCSTDLQISNQVEQTGIYEKTYLIKGLVLDITDFEIKLVNRLDVSICYDNDGVGVRERLLLFNTRDEIKIECSLIDYKSFKFKVVSILS